MRDKNNHIKCFTKYLKKNKYFMIMLITIIMWILIPPFVNLILNTEAIIFSDFFGYVSSENSNAWISFYGSIIGGAITLIGVAWTIIDQNKKRENDIKDSVKPILVASSCTYEGIKNDGEGRVFECTLEYKNVGKGLLYNPRVFNIEHFIDQKVIGALNPSFSVNNYIDIGSTADNTVMILLSPEELNGIYESLKGRGNTLALQIIMYVGGKDMYGRDIITKLNYKSELTFFSLKDIQLPLFNGKLTSIVLFNEKEINKVIDNADWRYNVHR